MWHHGGMVGMTANEVLNFDADYPTTHLADTYLVIAPTYRSEPFRGGAGLNGDTSSGDDSPFDYDADDSIALLTAVLANMPQADPDHIVQWGRSRGPNVAWHVALRDPRINAPPPISPPRISACPKFKTPARKQSIPAYRPTAFPPTWS